MINLSTILDYKLKLGVKVVIRMDHLLLHIRKFLQWNILRIDSGRQRFFICKTLDIQNAYHTLIRANFQPNHFAYIDRGELYSLRRLKFSIAMRLWQQHVRIFEDGEIWAHYEITPEADLIEHLRGSTLCELTPETQEWIKTYCTGNGNGKEGTEEQ